MNKFYFLVILFVLVSYFLWLYCFRIEIILFVAWHGNVLGGVGPGINVAIWGAGPVGLLCIMWAKYRGAKRIFSIDCVEDRLDKARSQGAETIDFNKANVVDTMQKMLPGKILSFVM